MAALTLLDASALVAFELGEPAAREVRRILRSGSAGIAAPNLTEALDQLVRVAGVELTEIESVVLPLLVGPLSVVPVGEDESRRAATIRINHYHRQRAPLSLADCLLLGTAATHRARIATSDAPLAAVARLESIDVVPLRNSKGERA